MRLVLVVSGVVVVSALVIALLRTSGVLGSGQGLWDSVQVLVAPAKGGGRGARQGAEAPTPGAATATLPTDGRPSGGVPVVEPVTVVPQGPGPAVVPDPPAMMADPPPRDPTGATSSAGSPGVMPAPLADGWGLRPAPDLDPRPFSEAHWQGLEAIPRTAPLIEALGLPADVLGVVLDDVTLPADLQGFRAGDLVTAVAGTPTPDLLRFIQATDRVREEKRTTVDVVRAGAAQSVELVALFERLGTANGETPTMIPPGARSPHPYQGPCLNCHRIGTTGSLATDQGDTVRRPPPPIRAGSSPPHRDRGPCTACHRILP